MKNATYVVALLLALSLAAFAQNPQPQWVPPDIMPKGFPPDIAAPASEPNWAKSPRHLTSKTVKSAIANDLRRHKEIASGNINVNVTDDAVVLYGSVPSIQDDTAAKWIAESHAGERRVEDNLQIGPSQ
jgi:BON domain